MTEFPKDRLAALEAALSKEKIDSCILDGKLPDADRRLILSSETALRSRPITILSGVSTEPSLAGVDLILPTPHDSRSAFKLVNLCLRTKVPTRVLITDDSHVMRSIIRKVLSGSKFAFDVLEASDGHLGLAALRQVQVNLVFLDFHMLGLNGFDVFREIQKYYPAVGVVMISSSRRGDLSDRAHRAGVLAFLRKPFYSEDVDVVVDRFYRFHIRAEP